MPDLGEDDPDHKNREAILAEKATSEALSAQLKVEALRLNRLRHEANRQPYSLCHADQMGHDFPATIVYNAYFDVWLRPHPIDAPAIPEPEPPKGPYEAAIRKLSAATPEPVKLIYTQPGVAIATDVQGIPPRNVVVAFDKPMVVEIPGEDPQGSKPMRVTFGQGFCTGMQTVSSKKEFLDGINRARALRGASALTLDQV